MTTYPYTTPDGIIELVRKDDYDTALELIREIRDNEVNPQDEADKFLRDHQPSELSVLRVKYDTDIRELNERLTKQQADMLDTIVDLRLEPTNTHSVLDNDESKIIRNAKDGYPEGREDRVLTLAERVKSLCIYAADWKRWTEEKEAELTSWQSLAESLATALDDCNTKLVGWHGLYPSQVGSDDEATFQAGDKALAAYESAKSGNLPDPLAEAVKRMEEVPYEALDRIIRSFWLEQSGWIKPAAEAVRTRLISAAKGEQP